VSAGGITCYFDPIAQMSMNAIEQGSGFLHPAPLQFPLSDSPL
jgi:hypothetical protein